MDEDSRYLTIEQAAKYLNVSKKWMYVHAKEFERYYFGGQLRFTREQLDKYVESRLWSNHDDRHP